ncbi:hypothetical protein BVG79_02248 [Ketogulonicigenium robustum]|uniref:Uncharacterized protein n=2 Tax=Ketogulonicigenium robustum TaxID=92947 RepID=A0A1W6P242_9RHOB|nr:hypothetical protein BVG79_02248 [Ketogulonicigenium robustum]
MGAVRALVAGLAVVAGITPAIAQQTTQNRVGTFTNWDVYEEQSPHECMAVSQTTDWYATNASGARTTVSRGSFFLFVFFRPEAGVRGQIAYTGGYAFRDGSNVTLTIDGTAYQMFTQGEWAWLASAEDDARVVAALKRGSRAVVEGVSGRGNRTHDTFSLSGVTAAIDDAQRRCG